MPALLSDNILHLQNPCILVKVIISSAKLFEINGKWNNVRSYERDSILMEKLSNIYKYCNKMFYVHLISSGLHSVQCPCYHHYFPKQVFRTSVGALRD